MDGTELGAGVSVPPAPPFAPAFGLRSAFVQSVLATKRPAIRQWRRRGVDLGLISESRVLDCGDGVRLTGLLTRPTSTASRGLVVLIHGWEGCHESRYLYSMACALFQAGYSVFRLNLRDHAGTHHLNEEMFHSARTDEVIGAVRAIQALVAVQPLFVIGFSLGGSFGLRVGLHGPARGVVPALSVGISPVLDPRNTLQAIDNGPRVIHGYFVQKWRDTLKAKADAWPGRFDFSQQMKLTSFVEITRQFVAAHTDYPTMDDYFATYTLTPGLLRAAPSPLALITSRDDTVIPARDFAGLAPRGALLSFDCLDRGGHCGFVEDWRFNTWTETRVLQLLAARPG